MVPGRKSSLGGGDHLAQCGYGDLRNQTMVNAIDCLTMTYEQIKTFQVKIDEQIFWIPGHVKRTELVHVQAKLGSAEAQLEVTPDRTSWPAIL